MTDRRYGVNKYGDGKLYGSSDTRQALAWEVSIDWDEDDLFDGNEASRLTYIKTTRGRTELLEPVGQGFQAVPTGKAVVKLRNQDGRFDGWNAASPLYPNVDSGKDIRIRVRDLNGTASSIYSLFRGTIDDVVPVGYGDDAQVMIYASDGMDFLRNYEARVAMQQNITPDAAIGLALDSVGWPAKLGRSLDASVETIRYWWASGNRQAMSEIQDLANSFLGYFFIDRSGQARYIARSSISDAVANYPQDYLLKDIDNPQPFKIRRNVTRLKVHPRIAATTGVIWQLQGNTPSIPTGAANALTIFANYVYNNTEVPAINVIAPVATTDFLINAAADGGGADLTASCTVTMTDFGDTAKLVIANNSGSTGYPTLLRIRGDAIYEPNELDVTYPADLSTVARPRELLLDLAWQQDINVAKDISTVMGPFFAGRHPQPKVKIDDRPGLQYVADLFDIVTADLDYLGLSGEPFRVGMIEHETDPQFENCQKVQTRISLEPYITADNYMHWDTLSVWDTETVFGY